MLFCIFIQLYNQLKSNSIVFQVPKQNYIIRNPHIHLTLSLLYFKASILYKNCLLWAFYINGIKNKNCCCFETGFG